LQYSQETTSFGKSTIAADFCHLNRHFYEQICWIDSRSAELLDARVGIGRRALAVLTAGADRWWLHIDLDVLDPSSSDLRVCPTSRTNRAG
jgi:hypothetical protein